MCSRFALMAIGKILTEQFDIDMIQAPPQINYNIPPTTPVSVVVAGSRILDAYQWGLIPFWAKEKPNMPHINARMETAAEKPTFKKSFTSMRCLIPASGFYEWKTIGGKKQPYYISLKNNTLFAFAGLYAEWKGIKTCAIITREPNSMVKDIHNRMPQILEKKYYDAWLDPELADKQTIMELLTEMPPSNMNAWPVTMKMNNPRYKEPNCVTKISERQATLT